jgi:hypothetical protein
MFASEQEARSPAAILYTETCAGPLRRETSYPRRWSAFPERVFAASSEQRLSHALALSAEQTMALVID